MTLSLRMPHLRMPHARWQRWALIVLTFVVTLSIIAAFFIEEPLRRKIESNMNASLKGYKVSIRKLDFHPIGFSLDLEDWIVRQDAHPDPPMADVPNLTASVQWLSLLRGRLVANFRIDDPK